MMSNDRKHAARFAPSTSQVAPAPVFTSLDQIHAIQRIQGASGDHKEIENTKFVLTSKGLVLLADCAWDNYEEDSTKAAKRCDERYGESYERGKREYRISHPISADLAEKYKSFLDANHIKYAEEVEEILTARTGFQNANTPMKTITVAADDMQALTTLALAGIPFEGAKELANAHKIARETAIANQQKAPLAKTA